MKQAYPYTLFIFLLSLTLCSGIACNWIFPYETLPGTTYGAYYCSAQIYRTLAGGKEFTEEWQLYTWANDHTSALADATTKIEDYIDHYMAPGFTWDYRNLTAVAVTKEDAVDCGLTWDKKAISPPAYGAPSGAELRWNYPSSLQASSYFSVVDKDGSTRTAMPLIANAYVDFAERTGLPDSGGTYVIGQRHLRFSDIYIELNTPFSLGDISIKKFVVQNIGTVIAEDAGGTSYQVQPWTSKYFLYAQGEKSGETKTTSFCFVNEYLYGFTEYQGPPYAFFALSLNINTQILGQDMIVKLSLSKPAAPYSFDSTQPFVQLADKAPTTSPFDLEADIAFDHYYTLTKYLWFEDFESSNEVFLGAGDPLKNVKLSAGDHEITLVVYNSKGAYNMDTMTLTGVPNLAPVAKNDTYSVAEDITLIVSSPGVLVNDTDANGDTLSAVKVSGPAHGTLSLASTGAFTYAPNPDFYGTDTFTYKANDGTADSSAATVTITVTPVNDPAVAANDAYSVDEDTTLIVSAPGVLTNDVDPDGDSLTAIKITNPSHGSLTLNSNGSFTYIPTTDYSGTDSFTYKANDGSVNSNTATVTITVNYLAPDQEIEKQLKDMTQDLKTAGTLNAGQANSLLTKLDAAIQKIKAAQVTVACNLLAAFINEVKSLIATGVLTSAEGQPLIDKAQNIRGELGCK